MDLDDVIPGPHYRICHSRVARAPLPAVWDALHRVTMSALPLGHALEGMRVLPARLSGKKPGPLADRSFLDVTPIPVLFCERPQVLSREPLGAYIVSLSPAKTQEERNRHGAGSASAEQDPHKSPQAVRRAAQAAGRARPGHTAAGRMLAGGTGSAATRGGRPVIELECGITVYPAREEHGRRRAVWHENGERQQCEAALEEKLAARLAKVAERLEADAPK